MAQVLKEIEGAVAKAAEQVGPAVVGLGRGWGRGSGAVIADGQVLTNAHVLRGDEVEVTFAGERPGGPTSGARSATASPSAAASGTPRTAAGRVVGTDGDLDVAVIAVDTQDAPPIAWDPDAVGGAGFGTPVLAVANPGGRGLRVTFGLVSATGRSFRGPRGRRIAGSLEHSAPLPRGSSGSPLVDLDGRLLGLNTVRMEGGLILALPADAALRRRVDALARGEAGERPRLGIALAPPRAARRLRSAVGLPERDGLLVRGVRDGTPAARAGIQRGDLLVAVAGRELSGVDDLFDALEAAQHTLPVSLVRGSEELELTVDVG